LFFARALFVWFYNVTAFSVLLVAIFHASFDGAINQLSYDVVPASNTARFLIFSATIVHEPGRFQRQGVHHSGPEQRELCVRGLGSAGVSE